jgi:hypothetical protein
VHHAFIPMFKCNRFALYCECMLPCCAPQPVKMIMDWNSAAAPCLPDVLQLLADVQHTCDCCCAGNLSQDVKQGGSGQGSSMLLVLRTSISEAE